MAMAVADLVLTLVPTYMPMPSVAGPVARPEPVASGVWPPRGAAAAAPAAPAAPAAILVAFGVMASGMTVVLVVSAIWSLRAISAALVCLAAAAAALICLARRGPSSYLGVGAAGCSDGQGGELE